MNNFHGYECCVIAAFTSYNPDLELFYEAVSSVRPQVSNVIIVDNGSDNLVGVQEIASKTGSILISFGENKGIAAAYNVAFERAIRYGADWVLTCDQDSVMPDDMVLRLVEGASSFSTISPIGIVCPNFRNRTTGSLEFDYGEPRLIKNCISSGSLTSTVAWTTISGFDENMFIDGVDFEFCDRLVPAGFDILLVPNVVMYHEIGNIEFHNILGHSVAVLNHSPFRKFYIAQNIIYRDGKSRGGIASPVSFVKVLRQVVLVIAFEDDKLDKISSLLRGMKSGVALLSRLRRPND